MASAARASAWRRFASSRAETDLRSTRSARRCAITAAIYLSKRDTMMPAAHSKKIAITSGGGFGTDDQENEGNVAGVGEYGIAYCFAGGR